MHLHPAVRFLTIACATGLLCAFPCAAADTRAQRDAPPQRPPAPRTTESRAAVEQMMRGDTNKDGALSRDEVERLDPALVRRFSAADRNRDGRLTLAEFERLRALSRGATGGAVAGGTTSGSGPGNARR